MASRQLFLILIAAQSATAQTDLFGSIFSVAESFVTSLFAPTTTSTSSASTTSEASSTNTGSTTSSVPTTSSSQLAAPASSPTASSASTAAASQTSSLASSSSAGAGSDSNSNTLAIVLGCTLGALALAAFLALLFFCRRRRQRSRNASKHKALSTSDDEAEIWHHEKPRLRSSKEPTTHVSALDHNSTTDPLTHGQRTSNFDQGHHNPFVPVPPPARRSMHTGMHDDTAYSAHPFHPEDINAYRTEPHANTAHDHHGSEAMAAGAGGALLGGLAAHAKHRHDRKRSQSRGRGTGIHKANSKFSEDEHNALPEAALPTRRSGSVSRASAKEPWPFMDSTGKKSSDSARPSSRGPQSYDEFSTPNQYPIDGGHGSPGTALMGAAAAGGLAGAVASRKSKSRSPQRKGILKQNISDSSNPSSLTTEDYLPTTMSRSPTRPLVSAGPHELATSDTTSAGQPNEGHNGARGMAVPLAATVGASAKYHRRSGSGESYHSSTPLPLLVIPHEEHRPIIPSRSPKRTSLDYSRARYSSANEGTAELPSQQSLISPSVDAKKSTENDALLSPVSPISESQTGSWSKAQAESLGLGRTDRLDKPPSQESTLVNSATPNEGLNDGENHSSGLVSAIQRIFNSGKPMSEDHEALVENSIDNENHSNREKRLRTVPHRKPAPDRASHQPLSQYGDIAGHQQPDVMPGSWENAPARHSMDSARPLSPRFQSRGNSFKNTSVNDFVSSPPSANRYRPNPKPGYGLGSGDPFDLARGRTDSSMTGVSLSNYQEPTVNPVRPRSLRQSSGSDYKEPTLADLRKEVLAEDRQRAKQVWRNSNRHSRSNSAGLRYGDDRDLFDLIDQTTGHTSHTSHTGQGRYYSTTPQGRPASLGAHVGRAY